MWYEPKKYDFSVNVKLTEKQAEQVSKFAEDVIKNQPYRLVRKMPVGRSEDVTDDPKYKEIVLELRRQGKNIQPKYM